MTQRLRWPQTTAGKTFEAITRSFHRYSLREGFRLVHFSVQHYHLRLIAEVDSKSGLTQAMQRLTVSLARQLNFLWRKMSGKWTGRVFKERYHQHVIRNPQEVRAALLYVLRNALKHGSPDKLIVKATSWLLTRGRRASGLIKPYEVPRT